MPERSDDATHRVVSVAQREAGRMGHGRVGTEHLLLALLREDAGRAAEALRAAGATSSAARHKVVEALPTGDHPHHASADLPFSDRASRALDRAGRFSRQQRADTVPPEHLLLGVLDVEGLACQVLRGLGVDVPGLRAAVDAGRPADPAEAASAGSADPLRPAPPATQDAIVVPRCPVCAADLDGGLVARAVPVRAADEESAALLLCCPACGSVLGTAPDR